MWQEHKCSITGAQRKDEEGMERRERGGRGESGRVGGRGGGEGRGRRVVDTHPISSRCK